MTEIYLHFLFAHYGLSGNAPVDLVEGEVSPPGCPIDRYATGAFEDNP